MRRAGWIILALTALFLAMRVEAAGRAVAVVVDVTGEVSVQRKGEPRAITAYVGMDLFEGDRLSASASAEVTAFYESGGTVKHDVARGLVVAATAPVANKPGVLSRLGSSLSDLFKTQSDARADEAGAVEAGLVMARVAEEDVEPRKQRERLKEAESSKKEARSSSSVAPQDAGEAEMADLNTMPEGGPAPVSAPAPGGAQPPAEQAPRDEAPPAPAAVQEESLSDNRSAPNAPPPPPAGGGIGNVFGPRPGTRSGGGGGGGTAGDDFAPRTPAPKPKSMPRRREAPKRPWLPELTLDAALARAKTGAVDGSVPALATAPAGGEAWLALPGGERVLANLGFTDGAAVTLRVKPASGAGWSVPLTLAPAAEFDPVLKAARSLAAGGMGHILAARMLEQKGYRLAAYLVQRAALMRLRASGRAPVVLKRLSHQVAERALELGDFETVALLKADF
jgi:hypothetical protein